MLRRLATVCVLAAAACDGGATLVDAGDGATSDAGVGDASRDMGTDAPDLPLGRCGEQLAADTDGDTVPDQIEKHEADCSLSPPDTDGDGMPDYLDLDSDDDTILDATEWNPAMPDQDMDGIENFRDVDSDGDGYSDTTEAGDTLPHTAPVSCAHEWNPVTRTFFYPASPGMTPLAYPGDSIPDYLDLDSDNDSLADRDERRLGLDPCNPDTDADGFDDAMEGAYTDYACPGGAGPIPGAPPGACTLGAGGGTPPVDVLLAVLRYLGPAQVFTMSFDAQVRVADVFFVVDADAGMAPVITTLGAAASGIVSGVAAILPDVRFGLGAQQDFPFGGYGGATDAPFVLDATLDVDGAPLQTALDTLTASGGGDAPGAQAFALWLAITGHGETWSQPPDVTTFTSPDYGAACSATGYGAACFRGTALPVIVQLSDHCAHGGLPGEDPACDAYTGITATSGAPFPSALDAIAELARRGTRYVGIDTLAGDTCGAPTTAGGTGPCFYMRSVAEHLGSVADGGPNVVTLDPSADTATATATIVDAIDAAITRTPFDVDTALRGQPNPLHIDSTRFIKRRTPACNDATPPDTSCWVEPSGTAHDAAVRAYDTSTFLGVVPGTRVTFDVTLRNDFFPGDSGVEVFVAFVDARGGGSTVLDSRLVIVVVPATLTFPDW